MGTVVGGLCAIGAFTLAAEEGTGPSLWTIAVFAWPGIFIGAYLAGHSILKGEWPDLPAGSY